MMGNKSEEVSKVLTYLEDHPSKEITKLVIDLKNNGVTCSLLEGELRKGRITQPPSNIEPGKLYADIPLPCDHVNYETSFFLYLPKNYQPQNQYPLIVVGHGGNGNMKQAYARHVAHGYIQDWVPIADQFGFIIAAPLTERGWGNIGYSVIFSMLAKMKRWFRIDPDRIYMTGHSMGGHLSWRTALNLVDRFAAVAPMSGGYDYVEKKAIHMLWNVPGYATFGRQEPYRIDEYNRKMRSWLESHGYEWIVQEKNGGHEIFYDELPKVAQFFLAHPRNLYRQKVWGQAGPRQWIDSPNPGWKNHHHWYTDRTIPRGIFHWLRLFDQPDLAAGFKQQISGEIISNENLINLISNHVRKVRIYLHPKMVDFAKPLKVMVNGKVIFKNIIQPNMEMMLSTIREFDDWGRIFYAWIDLDIDTNQQPRIWSAKDEPSALS